MTDLPKVPPRMTALHEAGHAVALAFHGWRIESASIVSDGVAAGNVKTANVGEVRETDRASEVEMLEGAVVIVLAGNMAAYAGGELQEYRGTDDDHEAAAAGIKSLHQVTPWVGGFDGFARFQMLRAQRWVYRNMGAIDALAAALLDRKDMSGDEVSLVIDPFRVGGPARERSHGPWST